jgi:TfoX/Sxy family transcriptional regulator of competence genes
MMDFRKSPQALVDTFEAVVPGPPAQQRKMFGYPAAFVNSNMFMGLFQESMLIRLPEELRDNLLELPDARVFEPMPGRPMREYVVLPPALIADRTKLSQWVAKSFEYACSLPAKAARAKPAKGKAAAKKRSR